MPRHRRNRRKHGSQKRDEHEDVSRAGADETDDDEIGKSERESEREGEREELGRGSLSAALFSLLSLLSASHSRTFPSHLEVGKRALSLTVIRTDSFQEPLFFMTSLSVAFSSSFLCSPSAFLSLSLSLSLSRYSSLPFWLTAVLFTALSLSLSL
jgi:hypothetical protein